jgi:hypothetical protein
MLPIVIGIPIRDPKIGLSVVTIGYRKALGAGARQEGRSYLGAHIYPG